MEKIALVSDTTSYLPQEIIDKYNVEIVPLQVLFGEEHYKEETELSAADFYEKIRVTEKLPTTSQPAPGDFISVYEKLAEDYDSAIVVTLSSSVSGTYQNAVTAAETIEGIDIRVFDSEIACAPQGYYIEEAAQMREDGESIDAIMERLEKMRERGMSAYFMVDDLSHLHRGGRLSGAQAFVGSLLKMKPVLSFQDKTIVPLEKIRTKKKALNRILELFDEEAKTGASIRLAVMHANRAEDAAALKKRIEENYDHVHVDLRYFGAIIGTHLGEGAIGIGWYRP